jgi:predicted ArsR family transcriptional regulator
MSKEKLETLILELLSDGPLTRGDIVKKTGIPRTTIYDALKSLIKEKYVKAYPIYIAERKRGRPKIAFALFEE